MGIPSLQVTTLHGYTIEELIDLKNSTNSKYSRLSLTAITMRYCGYSNAREAIGLNKVAIVAHIKNSSKNKYGLKYIQEKFKKNLRNTEYFRIFI